MPIGETNDETLKRRRWQLVVRPSIECRGFAMVSMGVFVGFRSSLLTGDGVARESFSVENEKLCHLPSQYLGCTTIACRCCSGCCSRIQV